MKFRYFTALCVTLFFVSSNAFAIVIADNVTNTTDASFTVIGSTDLTVTNNGGAVDVAEISVADGDLVIDNNAGTLGTVAVANSIESSNSGGIVITNETGATITAFGVAGGSGVVDVTNNGTMTFDGGDGSINLGTNSASSATIAAGTVNGGIDIGHADQTVTFSGGNIIGAIIPTAASEGLVVVTSSATMDAESSYGDIAVSLASFTLNAGASDVFTSNGAINADAVTVTSGTLRLNGSNGDTSVIGDITLANSANSVLDIGSGALAVNSDGNSSGDITFGAAAKLATTIASSTVSGKATADGNVTIASTNGLDITISDAVVKTITSDTTLTLLDGATGSITAIDSANIDVNGGGSNIVGRYTFTTVKNGSDKLDVKIALQTLSAFSSNNNVTEGGLRDSVTALDSATNVTGELSTISDYIFVNSGVNASQRKGVLESIAANDIGMNQNTFNITREVNGVIENRLGSMRTPTMTASKKAPYKTVNLNGEETKGADSSAVAASGFGYANDGSDYDGSKNFALWAQVLTNTSEQKDKKGYAGYDSKLNGITIGGDVGIDNSSVIGLALTIANSEVEASNHLKRTVVDSYQLSIYGEKLFANKYYIDGFVTAAQNRYSSDKTISLIGKSARAHYNGETYSAKLKTGMINRVGKFEISPELSAFYAHNSTSAYRENGAGTANLSVAADYAQMFEGTVGLNFAYNSIEVMDLKILPTIGFSYGYDFIGDEQSVTANFVGQTATFNSQSSKANRRIKRLDTSVDLFTQDSFTLTASYLLEMREEFQSQTGLFRARYQF